MVHKCYIRSNKLQKMNLKQKLNRSLINLNCQERAKTGFKWPRGRKLPTTRGAVWGGGGEWWFSGLRGCVLLLPFFDSICPSLHLSASSYVSVFLLFVGLFITLFVSLLVFQSVSLSFSLSLSSLSRCEGCVINKS